MHAPTIDSTYESSTHPARRSSDFFLTNTALPILRSVFFYGLLWTFLAFVLYGVYTLIVSH